MNPIYALIFLAFGSYDMAANHCSTGCFAPNEVASRLTLQGANIRFLEEDIGQEFYLDYGFPTARGPFQPVVGLSVSEDGAAWLGFGVRSALELGDSGFLVETSLMPGYYDPGEGPEIGGNLHFRSSLGLSYEFDNGGRLGMFFDHRSNADTQSYNPGLDTYGIRYSIALD